VEKVVAVIGIVAYKREAQKRRAEGKSAVKKDAFPVPGIEARSLVPRFAEDAEPGIDQGGNAKNNNESESKNGNKFLFTHFTPP
jgi:hypothetical protein